MILSQKQDKDHITAEESPEGTICTKLICIVVCAVSLNANRQVTGVLRGFDQFMNIVLDNAVDEKNKTDIGMVVRGASKC